MKAFRTFVAVLIDEHLKKSICGVQREIRQLAPDVKWVAPENLHVTLKFLGDVTEDVLPDVFAAVERAAASTAAFELSVSGLGAFPNPRNARVVWVGIEKGRDELVGLASSVESELVATGFAQEEKPFKAHITIGRTRPGRGPGRLADGIARIDAGSLGSQQISSVSVMRSDLQPGGPVYTVVKTVQLAS